MFSAKDVHVFLYVIHCLRTFPIHVKGMREGKNVFREYQKIQLFL